MGERERERDVFDETPKERERSRPQEEDFCCRLFLCIITSKNKAGRLLCFQRCFDDDDDDDDDDVVFSPWGRIHRRQIRNRARELCRPQQRAARAVRPVCLDVREHQHERDEQ